MSNRKSIGLALGSGSSRGWAHIGVIEALKKERIPIDYIAGCSVGGYIGAIYASGGLDSLKEFTLSMDGKKVFSYFDVVFPRSGLLDGNKKLQEFLSCHTDAKTFEDLSVPVMMVATDLETGDKVVLKSGDLFSALRATMSMPGLFSPIKLKNKWLVDGGLVDPVPIGIARAMGADVVIAVNLNSGLVSKQKRKDISKDEEKLSARSYEFKNEMTQKLSEFYENAESIFKKKIKDMLKIEESSPDIIETVAGSIEIMQERITRINLAVDRPDILIEPLLGDLKMMDFDQVERAIEEGYQGVMLQMENIKEALGE